MDDDCELQVPTVALCLQHNAVDNTGGETTVDSAEQCGLTPKVNRRPNLHTF